MGRLLAAIAASLVVAWAPVVRAAPAQGSGAASSSEPAAAPAPSSDAPPTPLHWLGGPRTIDLGHDITLDLPERHAFLAGPEAAKLLEKNGSFHNEDLAGFVVGKADGAKWFVTIRYNEEGYVKDTESIDAAQLLQAIKDGTEEANKERVERGFHAFHVQDWSEPPHYDKAMHRLVWGLTVAGEDGTDINFNTRVLGRRGIASLNLVCDPADLAAEKPEVADLLAGTRFNSGARYDDFDAKRDKVAEYGLAGLILGGVGLGAAKLVKIGLIAKFWNVILAALLAAKKAIVVAVAGGAAYVRRLFAGKKKPVNPPSSAA